MIPSDHFVYFYNEVFTYIARRGVFLLCCSLAVVCTTVGAFGADRNAVPTVTERLSIWPNGREPNRTVGQSEAVMEMIEVPNVRSRALVLVIGGGSYQHLPFVDDPVRMVNTLCSNGVRCVNFRHRCPRPEGKPKHLSAWQDVQRAVRVCRANAARWNVDPEKIGVIGFSAGGHCALLAAVSSLTPAYEPVDEIDRLPCNVNFAVPAYPAYVLDGFDNLTNGFTDGRKGHEREWMLPLGEELAFDKATPPVFLMHGEVDGLVPVMGTAIVFNRLLKAGVPVQFYALARRDHGFGPDCGWCDRVVEWMRQMKVL